MSDGSKPGVVDVGEPGATDSALDVHCPIVQPKKRWNGQTDSRRHVAESENNSLTSLSRVMSQLMSREFHVFPKS